MSWLKRIRRYFRVVMSIAGGTDVDGTIAYIQDNSVLRGSNVWLLICSAILSSIGLDINSTAVIIGAMLISPLMSPILGAGVGVAILDRKLLRRSMTSLLLATFISLLTSFLYFTISPLGQITSELSARTTPTILDVGIAFFGGVAGIVAGSRKNKSSAIPGVAIATALMPPVCTAGFGLAIFSSTIFLGAFYLFLLNSFFIATATYLVAILLKFPKRSTIDHEQDANVKRLIVGFAILISIPSAVIFYNVLRDLRFERGVKNFVNTEIRTDDRQPLRWNVQSAATPPTLKVYTVGNGVGKEEQQKLKAAMSDYGIGSLDLKIVQMNVSPSAFQQLSNDVESTVTDKLHLVETIDEAREKEIEDLRAQIDAVRENSDPKQLFLRRMRRQFQDVATISWQKSVTAGDRDEPPALLVVEYRKDISDETRTAESATILARARQSFPDESIEIFEMTTADNEDTTDAQK